MLERFRVHLERSGLIPDGASVLVGYSGGADSTCLLHLCHRLGLDVAAAHLHHGQRVEAEQELGECERVCREMEVAFVSGRADVPKMGKELGIGLEEAGRKARYTFLESAAYRLSCDRIATAHTRTDLVETVLLNLTRGAGLHGLAGIPAQRGIIVRPMLPFSQEETRAYCDEHSLWYHDDPANFDAAFSRSRIRLRVVPELRSINPAFDEAVERMTMHVSEEDRFLNGMAAAALEQCERPLNGELRFLTLDSEVAFDRAAITGLPPVLFKRCVRLAAEALGGVLDHTQTEAVVAGMQTEKGSVTADGGGVAIEWTPDMILVRRLSAHAAFRYPLTVPGETISDEFGWQLACRPAERNPGFERTDLTVFLDPARIKGQLYFRGAQPADSVQPVGFDGHRKVASLLSDSKLTRMARARLPIICDMLGPIWIPGVCLDARAAPGIGSGNVLRIEFGPLRGAP